MLGAEEAGLKRKRGLPSYLGELDRGGWGQTPRACRAFAYSMNPIVRIQS